MPIVFDDGPVNVSICGRVLAGFWRAPFSRARLEALRDLTVRIRAANPDQSLGLIAVFDADAVQLSVLTDQTLRHDAARLQREFVDVYTGGQCIVLEGAGFAIAAMRATALAVQSISRMGASHTFHPDTADGVRHLAQGLQLSPTESSEVLATLDTMRRRTRKPAVAQAP